MASSRALFRTAGAASQLVFGTQPGTTVAGQQITPAVKLRALDALGNVATGVSGALTLALGSNPGGATLSGTLLGAAGGGGGGLGGPGPHRAAPRVTPPPGGGGRGARG